MVIKTVSFRGSIQIGKFQYLQIEAMAQVEEAEETPTQALEKLKIWVAKELQIAAVGEDAVRARHSFTEQIGQAFDMLQDIRK